MPAPTPPPGSTGRYEAALLAAFLAVAVALGVAPLHRSDWLLENVLTVLVVALLVATHRRFPLSRLSHSLLFAFLLLHEVGSHYTYSEVPYDRWWSSLTGGTLSDLMGWERNHYDRLVHFAYGVLLAYPLREVFVRVADARGFWGYFLPFDLVVSTSATYELIEWGAAVTFGGELGNAYLGAQGDRWDAQKDMALAGAGALIALTATALVYRRANRDFQREWAESLRIKRREPLNPGEPRGERP